MNKFIHLHIHSHIVHIICEKTSLHNIDTRRRSNCILSVSRFACFYFIYIFFGESTFITFIKHSRKEIYSQSLLKLQSLRMEDTNHDSTTPQMQRNLSANLALNSNTKTSDKTSSNNTNFTVVRGLSSQSELVTGSESDESEFDDSDSDIISEHIGHIGKWQLFWAIILCCFQFPTTFHIFCLVFQVSFFVLLF
jgi:hypothetical protein